MLQVGNVWVEDPSCPDPKSEPIPDYSKNGLITKIWGSAAWTFGHCVTFGYPIKPEEEHKIDYYNYFVLLGQVLPCMYCRDSYNIFIRTGETELTMDVMASRDTLTYWFYLIHCAVNNKLGVDYAVTYKDLCERFESFRAKCGKPSLRVKGCVAPLDYKAFSFKKLYDVDPPIIPLSTTKQFVELAKARGINIDDYRSFLNLATVVDGDYEMLKSQPVWPLRNKVCREKIQMMRVNAIDSIEEEGIWKGTPTIEELRLILLMSSNLGKQDLQECLDRLKKIEISNI